MIGFVLVLLACLLWAVDTLIRYPMVNEGVPSFSIVFYEHLFLTTMVSLLFRQAIKKLWKMPRKDFINFLIIGTGGSALATLAFTQAFNTLNPSLVILLQKFQPVVAIFFAHYILDEKIKGVFVFWATICLIGAVLISYEDFLHLYNLNRPWIDIIVTEGSLQGYLCVAFSVLGWGASTVYGKKLLKEGYKDNEVMSGRFLFGFLGLLPFLPFQSTIFTHSFNIYRNVFLMVLVSGLLAMYLYYHGLRKLSARACSLTELSFPFMAVIVNWIFLGAQLSLIQLAGGALLLIGSFIIQFRRY